MATNEAQEELGRLIDNLDGVAHAMHIPIPDAMHMEVLRQEIPKLVEDFKNSFYRVTGYNPWE